MTDLTPIFEQIEALTPELRARLLRWIALEIRDRTVLLLNLNTFRWMIEHVDVDGPEI